MIEPTISLAFALQSNRGAYALLLGSGVSRSAGVPTGWEVVLDLVEKVAQLQDGDLAGDPAQWYRDQYQQEPDYSALLQELAAEPAERNRLLSGYFEPTEEEREQGLKMPTAAHHAIAKLVRDGYVRVIVTTNFDRLLERALDAAGVAPTVIATPDAVEGALPLVHTDCTILKVHGDYLDARIRNTPDELATYDPRLNNLLDRIFDEYGLVICGWSSDWDTALRDAISRCPTRRFTTFWAARGELSQPAQDLLRARRGVQIAIGDADSFFTDIVEKVESLAELGAPHPLSARLAVATLKRYLADERYRIRLNDLLFEEVARVEQETTLEAMPVGGSALDREQFRARLARYEAICQVLNALMATGAYWMTPAQQLLLTQVLERLGNRWREPVGGLTVLLELLDYPASLALYSAGLGAVAAGNLETLAHLLGDVQVRRRGDEPRPLLHEVAPVRVVEGQLLQPPAPQGQLYTPVNDHVHDVLREPLRELIARDDLYTEIFDRFEYLLSLAFADLYGSPERRPWAPIGSYGWRQRWRDHDNVINQVEQEATAAGDAWPFLRGPLFGGTLENFLEVKRVVDEDAAGVHWR